MRQISKKPPFTLRTDHARIPDWQGTRGEAAFKSNKLDAGRRPAFGCNFSLLPMPAEVRSPESIRDNDTALTVAIRQFRRRLRAASSALSWHK